MSTGNSTFTYTGPDAVNTTAGYTFTVNVPQTVTVGTAIATLRQTAGFTEANNETSPVAPRGIGR